MIRVNLTNITEENIEAFSSLFLTRPNPGELAVGAISDDTAVGVAVFRLDPTMITLLYIFVAPEYRRNGIGTELVKHTADAMADVGVNGIYAACAPADTEVLALLRSMGFTVSVSKRIQSLSIRLLMGSESIKKYGRKIMAYPAYRKVLPMNKADNILSMSAKKAFSNRLADISMSGDMLISGDYTPGLSFVVYEDRLIKSILLTSTFEGTSDAVVTLFASFSDDPAEALALLCTFFAESIAELGPQGEISFAPVDADMRDKICSLIGENVPDQTDALQAIKILKE